MERVAASFKAQRWPDRYGAVLYRYAFARVSDAAVAEELVQETFLAGLRSAQNFGGISTVQTWLIGIFRHKISDHFRGQFRRQAVEVSVGVPTDLDDPERDLFDEGGRSVLPPAPWDGDPHQALQSKQFYQILADSLNDLPVKQRCVLLLRVHGLSTEQICHQLNMTPTHVWVLTHRARGAVRRSLEERWLSRRPTNPR